MKREYFIVATPPPSCNPDTEFDCSGGKGKPHCINILKVCNGANDCGQMEDEKINCGKIYIKYSEGLSDLYLDLIQF